MVALRVVAAPQAKPLDKTVRQHCRARWYRQRPGRRRRPWRGRAARERRWRRGRFTQHRPGGPFARIPAIAGKVRIRLIFIARSLPLGWTFIVQSAQIIA